MHPAVPLAVVCTTCVALFPAGKQLVGPDGASSVRLCGQVGEIGDGEYVTERAQIHAVSSSRNDNPDAVRGLSLASCVFLPTARGVDESAW